MFAETGRTNEVAVVFSSCRVFFFDTSGGTYTPKHGVTTALKYDTGECLFVFTDCAGVAWYFESDGQFLKMVSPGGETIEVTAYTPDGKIDTISRAITENGSLPGV